MTPAQRTNQPSAAIPTAGAELRRAEALLKTGALQNAIFNSVNFSSIATDEKGVIQIFNVGAERMLGYAAAEVVNTITPADISDPQELIARAEALSATVGTSITPGFEALVFKASRGIEDIYELTYIRKDGSRLPASVSVTALRDDLNTIIGYLLIGTDNTARMQVETERRRLDQVLQEKNVELERANLAKSDFLSSMSHELRSPLNAILGFAQLLKIDRVAITPSQSARVDHILHAGWYLLELINGILDLAQIESGMLSLSKEPVSLSEVMIECQAMVEPERHTRGISMTFPEFESPSFVLADRTRLKQVIINLLSNALKYNCPLGSVAVTYSRSAAGRVRISIADTGRGLPPEKMSQLFQSFNRLGQEAGAEKGTGIGLVVSKDLVELMGGSIGAESVVGEGSVFWIELNGTPTPAAAIERSWPGASAPRAQPDMPVRTLLYVEDNPANLALVEQLLEMRSDLHLLSARDGHLGVQTAREALPEVILMDINLPGLNGFDALAILRQDPTTTHIPIVALSANAMPRDIQKGLDAGFFRYLTKPIKVDEFMETLTAALDLAATRATPSV
jgi:signal transduction histidine kinase/ActR/RegA family two-component response regulator